MYRGILHRLGYVILTVGLLHIFSSCLYTRALFRNWKNKPANWSVFEDQIETETMGMGEGQWELLLNRLSFEEPGSLVIIGKSFPRPLDEATNETVRSCHYVARAEGDVWKGKIFIDSEIENPEDPSCLSDRPLPVPSTIEFELSSSGLKMCIVELSSGLEASGITVNGDSNYACLYMQ